jgi:hypothetical protein
VLSWVTRWTEELILSWNGDECKPLIQARSSWSQAAVKLHQPTTTTYGGKRSSSAVPAFMMSIWVLYSSRQKSGRQGLADKIWAPDQIVCCGPG